jgi:uncharacterized protein (TIGR03083 family)
VTCPEAAGQAGSPLVCAAVDHAAALVAQNRMLGELYRSSDPGTDVPTCPGWTLGTLATHVGRGDRWAATIVRERSATPVDPRTVAGGKPPAEIDGVVDWLGDGVSELLDAVRAVGPETEVWTFTGPQPGGWWIRRRLHEATVHRADAALAVGSGYELAPQLAADGLSEWLDLVAARPAASGPTPLAIGQTLHLHATDVELGEPGEWLVHGDGSAVNWEHGHAKGQVAVRGAAVHLLLAALRRIPADDDRLQIIGDSEIWQTWLLRTGF